MRKRSKKNRSHKRMFKGGITDPNISAISHAMDDMSLPNNNTSIDLSISDEDGLDIPHDMSDEHNLSMDDLHLSDDFNFNSNSLNTTTDSTNNSVFSDINNEMNNNQTNNSLNNNISGDINLNDSTVNSSTNTTKEEENSSFSGGKKTRRRKLNSRKKLNSRRLKKKLTRNLKKKLNSRKKLKGGNCYGTGVGANNYDPNNSIYNTNMLQLFPYKPQ